MANNLVSTTILAPLAQSWTPKNYFYSFYFCYMLDINASYHCMQFQGKLMNQTWENDKKPNSGPDYGPFAENLGAKTFFRGFYLY